MARTTVNQQCLVYEFKWNLCDVGYVGYTRSHLHERVEGHIRKSSSIYKHYNFQHNSEMPERFIEQFHIITKYSGKFDCLVKEMLYIRMRKPILKVQTDSIRASCLFGPFIAIYTLISCTFHYFHAI